jgi:uncharacterized protein YdeI (YjbR/CyaY-like superfamily)
MGKKDPRVDAYIAKSADFARPLLVHLRRLIHAACPAVEETMKWRAPFFTHHGIVCGMAAFKQHCTLMFWNHELRTALVKLGVAEEAYGQFGRLTSIDDLPSDAALKRLVAQAARWNESGEKKPTRVRSKPKKKLTVPAELRAALSKNKRASATFAGFSYTNRKEYVDWITEAKRPETRKKRLAAALEWLAEGKSRNWKYQ